MGTDFSSPPNNYSHHGNRGADSWKKYLAIAVIAVVVMVAGAVIGSGITIMYFGRMFLQQPSSPDQAAQLITTRISSAADLSPEERIRTLELVQKEMDEIAAIRKKYEEEVNKKLGSMSEGVTEIIGKERSDRCGDWMRRYHPQTPGNSEKRKKDCCSGGNGSECGIK